MLSLKHEHSFNVHSVNREAFIIGYNLPTVTRETITILFNLCLVQRWKLVSELVLNENPESSGLISFFCA